MKSPEIQPIEQQPDMTIEEARMCIEEVRGRVAQMGANDSEFWSLDQIRRKLDNKELIPEEAVKEAELVFSSKQDYR